MKQNAIILIISIMLLSGTVTQAEDNRTKYGVDISVNSEGDIEYTSDYTENEDCNMYFAVYEVGRGVLEAVKINAPSGIIEVDAGKTYNAASYFWKKNMEPVSAPVRVNNLSADTTTYVIAEKQARKGNSSLSISDNTLIVPTGEQMEIATNAELSDNNADSGTQNLYAYLSAIGKSKSILFGQQNNISHKAGSKKLSDSDIYDVTGDYSAVCGLDTLSLTGDEYSAYVCNNRYGTNFPQTAAGNVQSAVYLTNKVIENGAVVTLSAHMPNFSLVTQKSTDEGETYAKYDFSGYTPDVLTGNTVNEILDGGKYNAIFNAYLDMIADYADSVNGTILFRPFHENTGSWFWWGADFCTAEQFKKIYSYTVEYLRDIKGVHNLLYVYSPSYEFNSTEDYMKHYPGDDYVDIVGFDMYNRNPDGTDEWIDQLKIKLSILDEFASEHNKVSALTETGISNDTVECDSQTALLKFGNCDKDWFNNVLDAVSDSSAAYFMVWANFGETDGFYTPYVKKVNRDGSLYGHEMMDNFIEFYNDKRSIFSSDQERVLEQLCY